MGSLSQNNSVSSPQTFPIDLDQVYGSSVKKIGAGRDMKDISPPKAREALSKCNTLRRIAGGEGRGKRTEKISVRHHRLASSDQNSQLKLGSSRQGKGNPFKTVKVFT